MVMSDGQIAEFDASSHLFADTFAAHLFYCLAHNDCISLEKIYELLSS